MGIRGLFNVLKPLAKRLHLRVRLSASATPSIPCIPTDPTKPPTWLSDRNSRGKQLLSMPLGGSIAAHIAAHSSSASSNQPCGFSSSSTPF